MHDDDELILLEAQEAPHRNARVDHRSRTGSTVARVLRVPSRKTSLPGLPPPIVGGIPPRSPYPYPPYPFPQWPQPPAARSIPVGELAEGVALAADGLAAVLPLPAQPPAPTGNRDVDLANQDEHRHALAAHDKFTQRIRTGGRILGGLLRLVFGNGRLTTT